MRSAITPTTSNQRTSCVKSHCRQPKPHSPPAQSWRGVLAKGYCYYACLRDDDTAVGYFEQARQLLPNSSRIPELLAYVARRRGQWEQSEAHFEEAERLDPRTSTYSPSTRFPLLTLVVSQKRCESWIRFSTSRRTTSIRSRRRRPSHKPKAICRARLRSSRRSARPPSSTKPWKHKRTKRSWSVALHKLSFDYRRYWPSRIRIWVTSIANYAFG